MILQANRHVFQTIAPLLLLCAAASTGRCDTVYVLSFTDGRLIRYESADPNGSLTTLLAPGQLPAPSGMALGPDGKLYIGTAGDLSTIAPGVSSYDLSTGTLASVFSFGDYDLVPGSLAFQGTDLLVGRNPFFNDIGPIVRLTNVTSGTISSGDFTSGTTLASSPGLAFAADGRLYVSDQSYENTVASGPVKRFAADGQYIGEVIASGASGLSGPTGLLIRGDTLYTASVMNGAILQTNLTTNVTQSFGTTGASFGVGVLAGLSDGGLLAGSPSGDGNIYRFAADGTLSGTFAPVFSGTLGLGQVGGIVTVPEPGALAALGLGLVAAAGLLRRRFRSRAAS